MVKISHKPSIKTENTYYTDSRPSAGRWKVTESQYCSKWGSTLYWGCYDVFVEKKQTRTVIHSCQENNFLQHFLNTL